MNLVPKMVISHVSESEVLKLINSLNNSHTFGYDGIDSQSLKQVAESIKAPITHIINMSIHEKKFPGRWKIG